MRDAIQRDISRDDPPHMCIRDDLWKLVDLHSFRYVYSPLTEFRELTITLSGISTISVCGIAHRHGSKR